MKMDEIKDPRLRARVLDALTAAGQLKKDVASACPKKRRIRQDHKPLMNKLEDEFASYMEMSMYGEHGIACVLVVQALRFRLANGLWYKPDFFWPNRLRAYEVKGPHSFRGGFENLKMAAHQYPWIKWILVWKEDGQWQEQTILP